MRAKQVNTEQLNARIEMQDQDRDARQTQKMLLKAANLVDGPVQRAPRLCPGEGAVTTAPSDTAVREPLSASLLRAEAPPCVHGGGNGQAPPSGTRRAGGLRPSGVQRVLRSERHLHEV